MSLEASVPSSSPRSDSHTETAAINALRCLAIDMVEAANSGHPGAPMGQAAMAYTLWSRFLRFDPKDPEWPNRDRFVLSSGHASALIYGLLHLSGYDLSMDDLRAFRQWDSKTPGHPEYGHTVGVETTTGPLGQGISTAVGMAMAEELLASQFNRDGHDLFDHRTWVIASDGDLMEGIASEACSMAGHLGLGKLTVLYDANEITIDGGTDLSFSEDVEQRFQSYGWFTRRVEDGNDVGDIAAAIEEAKADPRPALLLVRTHIGYGSPNKQDSSASHGSPLGAEEAVATKANLGWPHDAFTAPPEAYEDFATAAARGRAENESWQQLRTSYAAAHPELAAELERRLEGALPEGLSDALPRFEPGDGPLATRKASGAVLNAIGDTAPELVGGSADLTGSNNTYLDGLPDWTKGAPSRNLRYGVREHAMAAAATGMALSGALRPYVGTFLVFSDYMRPSIRLAALMGQPVVYVLTHDSIFLGEDGPTHQPVEHLASLRAMPGLRVIRPADANETSVAWRMALESGEPTALVLTRQKLPILDADATSGALRGGYVLADCEGTPDAILVATGSEVQAALGAKELLDSSAKVRVVSLPCWEAFAGLSAEERRAVIDPSARLRVAVEAGSSFGWERWIGEDGKTITVDRFGASAPLADLIENFGYAAEQIAQRVRGWLEA